MGLGHAFAYHNHWLRNLLIASSLKVFLRASVQVHLDCFDS